MKYRNFTNAYRIVISMPLLLNIRLSLSSMGDLCRLWLSPLGLWFFLLSKILNDFSNLSTLTCLMGGYYRNTLPTKLDIYNFIQADFSNVCFLALLSIHHRFRRNKIRKSVTWMPSIDINYSNTSPIHWMDEVKILVILCCCVTKFILAC